MIKILLLICRSFLECLPPDTHWFCSRTGGQLEYDQVEIKQEEPEFDRSSASSLKERLDAFCIYLYIYSYDGDDSLSYTKSLESHIERNLARCDACIIGYYQTKHRWTDNVQR